MSPGSREVSPLPQGTLLEAERQTASSLVGRWEGEGAKLYFRRSVAGSPGDEVSTGVMGTQVTLCIPGQLGTTGRKRAHVPSPTEHWKNGKNSHE